MAYAVRADIEAIFGVKNVKTWGDLDNDEVSGDITARVNESLIEAQAIVESVLRDGPYAIPFVDPIPQLIKSVTARLAGVWLYECRAIDDAPPDSQPDSRIGGHRKRAMDFLMALRSGAVRLDDDTAAVAIPFVQKVVIVDTLK